VLHPEQQQQQQKADDGVTKAAAAAAATALALPAAAEAEHQYAAEQFGSSLMGYGTACLKRPAQKQQQGEDGPSAKRPRSAGSQQQQTQLPGTPSQGAGSSKQQPPGADADVAAALAASAVEGLGLPPAAAAGLQQAMGLTAETGAIVPVLMEGEGVENEDGSNAAAAAAAAAGDGSDGDGDSSSSSSSSSDGTDLGEVDDDEIEAYIRPQSAVKIQEVGRRVILGPGQMGGAVGGRRGTTVWWPDPLVAQTLYTLHQPTVFAVNIQETGPLHV
jgi:hypothetical protein